MPPQKDFEGKVRMRRISPVALLLLSGGCTWISTQDVDARRVDLDDDLDGYIASEDCDDSDASISPGAEEIWYDGIDSDCLGDDDFDADKDGYVLDIYLGGVTAGVATSGLLPGGDCDDTRRAISPDATDGWYDGIDSDCSGNDDYDYDGDGYVADAYVGLATQYVDGSGSLPGGDCDDHAAGINAGEFDTWYDGIDTDCSGNDDYDFDGDGYVADDDVGKKTRYVSSSGGLPGGDCDDENSYAHAGAPDTWYDGLDWDCAQDDDFDRDGDGYVQDIYEGRTTEGVDSSGELPGGDCSDSDAEINPGQMEVLSDARDLDCDQRGAASGATSFTASALEGYTDWQDPFAPRFAENVSHVYLSLATYKVRASSSSTYYDSALAVSFDGLDPLAGPLDEYVWLKHVVDPNTYSLTAGHDFVVTNEYLFGVTGLLFSTTRSLRLGGFDLIDGVNGLSGKVYSTGLTTSTFTDMSIVLDDDGTLYALGCDNGDGIAQYMRASLKSAVSSLADVEQTMTGLRATRCELSLEDAPDALVYSAQSAGLVTNTFDMDSSSPSFSRVSLNSAYEAVEITAPGGGVGGYTVVVDPDAIYIFSGGSITYTAALGEGPQAAQASYAPDGSLLIAYVDRTGEAHVLHGDPATGMVTYDILTDFAATEAAAWIESTGENLLVAVIGPDDVAFGAARL